MRLYTDPMEMVREVERDLFEMGVGVHPQTMQDRQVADDPDYATIETWAYGYRLNLPDDVDEWRRGFAEAIAYLGGDVGWAEAEFDERIRADWRNPGGAWDRTEWSRDLWGRYLHGEPRRFAYTYNERFREQIPRLVEELATRPDTRQAVLQMYDRHVDVPHWGGVARVPCSLSYQFGIRGTGGDHLHDDARDVHVVYTMRSCDFLTHFVHDAYLACLLLWEVAARVEALTGVRHRARSMTHQIGSLHAYRRDMERRGIF